jgi:hypothetical protein
LKKLEDCFSFFLQLDKKKCQLLVSFIAPAVLAIQTSCCSGALQLAAVGLKMTALQRILKPCASALRAAARAHPCRLPLS